MHLDKCEQVYGGTETGHYPSTLSVVRSPLVDIHFCELDSEH